MKYSKEISLGVSSVAFVLLIVFLSLLLGEKFEIPSCGCPHMVSQNFIVLFIVLSIIFVGGLLYYLLSLKIEAQTNIINKNIDLVYKCLDENEKSMLQEIIKNKGELPQKELNKKFGKVKAHRGLKKLKDKNMVTVKQKGKNNQIKLKEELKKELVE